MEAVLKASQAWKRVAILRQACYMLHPLNTLLQTGILLKWTVSFEKTFRATNSLQTAEEVHACFKPSWPHHVGSWCFTVQNQCSILSYQTSLNNQWPSLQGCWQRLCVAMRRSTSVPEPCVGGSRRQTTTPVDKKFTLIIDHQPLGSLFNPQKGVPAMTGTKQQWQRWHRGPLVKSHGWLLRKTNQ